MRRLHRPPLLLLKPFRSQAGSQSERGPAHTRLVYKGRALPPQRAPSYSLTNHLTIRAHPPTPLLCRAHTHNTTRHTSKCKPTQADTCAKAFPEGEISARRTRLCPATVGETQASLAKPGPGSPLQHTRLAKVSAGECAHSTTSSAVSFYIGTTRSAGFRSTFK